MCKLTGGILVFIVQIVIIYLVNLFRKPSYLWVSNFAFSPNLSQQTGHVAQIMKLIDLCNLFSMLCCLRLADD